MGDIDRADERPSRQDAANGAGPSGRNRSVGETGVVVGKRRAGLSRRRGSRGWGSTTVHRQRLRACECAVTQMECADAGGRSG